MCFRRVVPKKDVEKTRLKKGKRKARDDELSLEGNPTCVYHYNLKHS